ncbi:hypothetical protein H4S02_002157 [Coemansia sp. RSA 2611]|nr:hypothetical protein H4S02_002157 [Coemansia sp. RSA 2611]
MDSAPGAAVTALAAVLGDLEDQQQALVSRLQHLHGQLAGGYVSDELLASLTYYVNQAQYLQRRMTLIHGRVGDLKRRADRLREHRAAQSQQVAEWMRQEQSRVVPAAAIATTALSPSQSSDDAAPMLPAQPTSLPASPVVGREEPESVRQSVLSFFSPLRISSSLGGGWSRESEADHGQAAALRSESPAQSLRSNASQPAAAAPGSPALSTASTLDSAAVPIATVKRKGKRRVRVPKIE